MESVWDYPRPPAVVPCPARVTVEHRNAVVADTRRALRVLETSHPPVFYLPPADVGDGLLVPSTRSTWCEWKGAAAYWHLRVGDTTVPDAAWSYPEPSPGFEALRGYVAFYPTKVDRCTVDGETVVPQPGDFYGGWITSAVTGPFKGAPGTAGW
ncbi:DUF427 domain-containing protein [Actinacidiphila acidipaludis]|uniref:DUF427 domain-containing protein n=1 Tax=Actinacidiphila acidipaludis TaxID=2873382 RepID=A0ABS7Q500_9ACTN|nr:DUF427 domain-containing protein [Streptomyces acidipaludis]MBY8878229.1 DUF427 domain-containing protein [Streptomyces acidipaludis]